MADRERKNALTGQLILELTSALERYDRAGGERCPSEDCPCPLTPVFKAIDHLGVEMAKDLRGRCGDG